MFGRGRASSVRRFAVPLLLLAAVTGAVDGWAAGPVTVEAAIDGRPAAAATERRPIPLRPRGLTSLDLRIVNAGAQPIEVRTVRLEGEVMSLAFFAYDTSVSVVVDPGDTATRTFELDLVGLRGQAIGLIPASVSLLDGERHTLASQRLIVDVRGSLWSVYGLFGIAVAVLTAVSLTGALVGLATHRLPDNRWRRGLRFLTPGVGLGLLVVFTLSALRVFVPRAGRWIPILLVFGGALFVLGYLTPSPDEDEDPSEDSEEALPDDVTDVHAQGEEARG